MFKNKPTLPAIFIRPDAELLDMIAQIQIDHAKRGEKTQKSTIVRELAKMGFAKYEEMEK